MCARGAYPAASSGPSTFELGDYMRPATYLVLTLLGFIAGCGEKIYDQSDSAALENGEVKIDVGDRRAFSCFAKSLTDNSVPYTIDRKQSGLLLGHVSFNVTSRGQRDKIICGAEKCLFPDSKSPINECKGGG